MRTRWVKIGLLTLIFVFLVFILDFIVRFPQTQKNILTKGADLTVCKRLAILRTATRAYEKANGKLPEDIQNEKSVPILGWAVRLLPFLETGESYEIDYHKAWDDPINKGLLTNMPDVFCHPLDENNNFLGNTHFALVQLQHDLDVGYGNYLILEVQDAIPWTKPGNFLLSNGVSRKLGFAKKGGFFVADRLGDVQFLELKQK